MAAPRSVADRGRPDVTDRVPVILSVDVEPDPFVLDRRTPAPWHGYAQMREFLARWREPLARATGAAVRYVWLLRLDPLVADVYGSASHVVELHPEWPAEFESAGDTLGVHLHATRWDARAGVWVHDYDDPDFMRECIASSTDAFRAAVGHACRAARIGEFWTSTDAVNQFEARGVRFDLTLEPGRWHVPTSTDPRERYDCSFPDMRAARRSPYQPSRADYRRPAEPGERRTIWSVPLSAARPAARLRARVGLAPRPAPDALVPVSMWQRWRWPNTFRRAVDDALAALERPYLSFAIRNPMEPGPGALANVDAALRTLAAHPWRERFVFCGPEEALGLLGMLAARDRTTSDST